ncbi:MAG: helicase [Deltaproteobacteria bacterium]|nr:helicase [Deltaproteobacteria bacterium]
MPIIEHYLTESAQLQLRESLQRVEGHELFFLGRSTQKDGRIDAIRQICRASPRALMMLYSLPQTGDVILHNLPTGQLIPTQVDEKLSHRFNGKGVGVFLINNEVSELYPLLEPQREETEAVELDEEAMAALLGEEGPLAESLPNYEKRQEQIELLSQVVRAFNRDQVLMAEAGTGTGKSLAYLIPAIYWARKNRERVLISTNTINLQEQIYLKDIPFLKRVLGEAFEAVLVKGRSNYLCLRKLHQNGADPDNLDEYEDRFQLQRLVKWAKRTASGDRSSLKEVPKQQVWSLVSADADTCQRSRCEYYNSCFYYIARRRQMKADLLITNHHVLFADLALREASDNYHAAALLPPYKRIVLDESHNIEDAGSSFLGFQVTRGGITRALAMLLKFNRRREEIGLLVTLAQLLLNNHRFIKDSEQLRRQVLEHLLPEVRNQRQQALRRSEKIHNLLISPDEEQFDNTMKIRVTQSFVERGPWSGLQELGMHWARDLHTLCEALMRFASHMEEATQQVEKQFVGPLMDLAGAINRIGNAASTLEMFFTLPTEESSHADKTLVDAAIDAVVQPDPEEEEELVRWIELRTKDSHLIKFQAAPLEIGASLERMIYDRFGSVVFTSATLATEKKDFSYIGHRLGLNLIPESRFDTACYPSPFDYPKQALIGIPTDVLSPKDPAFDVNIIDFIFESLRLSDGRAFVLSTSFKQLHFLYEKLAPRLKAELGIESLCQGKAQRHVLLKKKIDDERSVLFGTDSFWEGVDVRGRALQHVILMRLPFRVPSEPLIEARMESIETKGGNSFLEYTVPAATIKFKQGFGRLIRSQGDHGTVLILDKRVVEKRYGQRFLQALPEGIPRVIGPKQQVLHALADFHHRLSSVHAEEDQTKSR